MPDISESTEAPDWPDELAEAAAKLGPPSDVFNVSRSRAARKAFSGLALIVGGGIANYLYWVVFQGPVAFEHILFLLLFGPFVSGAGLIYAAWRDRGLWVLIYPVGLLRWQRGEVVTFPWDEVSEIAFYRVVECDRPRRATDAEGQLETCWLPIAKTGSKSLGAQVILRRADGAEATVPSSFDDFPRLCQVVQEQTFRVMWPEAWARFVEGKRVKFGAVALSLAGAHRDGDYLPWPEVADAQVVNGKLQIFSRALRRPWADVPLHLVGNPHVFVAMLILGPPSEPS